MSGRPSLRLAGFRSVALATALVLVASILAASPAGVTAQDGRSRSQIEGHDWQLLEYRGGDTGIQPVPPGIAVTASFFSGVLRGEGACSTFDASEYTLQKETLRISQPQVAARPCDALSQSIDDAFYRGLGRTATWRVDGSILELRDEVTEPILRFTRANVPDDPTIAPWEVARIVGSDGSIGPVAQGTSPTVQFTRGGRVFGSTDCGWFLGSYTTNGTRLDVGELTFNPSECTPALRAQAEAIVETLQSSTDFAVLPAGLTLEDDSGMTRMALVPAITLSNNATWTPISFPGPDGESIVEPDRLVTSSLRLPGGNATADGLSSCRRPIRASSFRAGLALSLYDVQVDDSVGNAFCKPPRKKTPQLTIQEIEDEYRERLGAVASHALRGTELELMDANGTPIIRLARQPEFLGVEWVVNEMDTRPRARKARLKPPREGTRLTATFDNFEFLQGDLMMDGARPRSYDAFYKNPRASTLDVYDITVSGNACNGAKARKPRCRQEQAFLNLLESADGFVLPAEGQLWLFRGDRKILDFVPARSRAATEDAEG